MIVVAPGDTPVTEPVADTVATAGADDVNVTGRPISALPAASRTEKVSGSVSDTPRFRANGVTTTDATFVTPCKDAMPVTPSISALIAVVPLLTIVTRPASDTVAIVGSAAVHFTAPAPLTGLPSLSTRLAASCCVWPMRRLVTLGVTSTLLVLSAGAVTASSSSQAAMPPTTNVAPRRRRVANRPRRKDRSWSIVMRLREHCTGARDIAGDVKHLQWNISAPHEFASRLRAGE